MVAIFLDTNLFIRFLVKNNGQQHKECVKLVEKISSGNFHPYTSNIVIAEILHVLIRIYKQPKKIVLKKIDKLLTMRNLTVIEKTNTLLALNFFHRYNLKYGDCLIATQVPAGVTLVTYDRDFQKISSISAKTPKEVLAKS